MCAVDQGSFRGGTRGNAVPIVKVFKNAQERNAAVKRQRNFLLSHQRFTSTSLHFLSFTSDNTIRENNWKPTFEIETKTSPLNWLLALLTNSQLLISDFVLISNGSKTNSSAGSEETWLFFWKCNLWKNTTAVGQPQLCKRGLPMSICLSVCPSNACIVTERTKVLPIFLYHIKGKFI